METLKFERPVEMLLALLRAALHGREPEAACFCHSTPAEWLQCYRLAVRQGVAPLAWGAVERVQAECAPPLEVKLSWAMFEERQHEKYSAHCLAAAELTRLYAEHGIAAVVLKGIGLSRLYPVPERREGGDVDIYTFSADRARMTDEEANSLANELMEQRGIEVDYSYAKVHTSFFFKGVRFENHRRFFNVDTFAAIANLDAWLGDCLSAGPARLLGGECEVSVPQLDFDRVYVPLHAAQHYGTGLSLRHLCDWAVLCSQGTVVQSCAPENEYLRRVTRCLTQLCNMYLGTAVPVDGGDDALPREMMREILYPPFNRKILPDNPVKAAWYKVRLKLHLLGLRHRLLGVSWCEGIARLLKSIMQRPSRLYK